MKRRLLSILLAVCLTVSLAPAAFAGSAMTDVKSGDWFAKEVAYVYENKLMNGVGNNAFDPNGNVSRAMVWTTLARLEGVNTANSDPWYLAGQNWAMLTGVSDGTDPNGDITREQLVTMLYRYAQLKGCDVSEGKTTSLAAYSDSASVSSWAVDAMRWACGTGLINGVDSKLAPQGSAIRAQLAVVLYRYADKVVPTEPQPELQPEPQPEPQPEVKPVVKPESKPKTYAVAFMYNYDDQGVYTTIRVERGDSIGTVTAPSREGYTFVGWYTDSGEEVTSDTTVYSKMTVYAKWEAVHVHAYSWTANNDGTHTGVCACKDTSTETCSYLEGEDVCADCGYNRAAVAMIGDTYYATLEEAAAVGGEITMLTDVDLATAVVITKDVTLNLNGKTLTVTEDTVGDGVFHVTEGTLTINGEGTINSVGKNNYSMAIWADGGKVIINGGTFTNEGAGEDDHYDLIYVKDGGSVEINGGTFKCHTPKWTLNKHDTTNGTIVVKGGQFKGYDPSASATENPVANFVAEGCFVVEENGYWTVEAVSGTADSLEELMAALKLGGEITLGADIDLPTAALITEDVTLNLNGKTLTVTEDTAGDGVFHVTKGTLTINGEGTINGVGKNNYSMAIWADGGEVIINGGTFTNEGAGEDDHYDLIYVKAGGSVEINGGTFKCHTPKWTLNKYDSTNGTIVVKGGQFKGYDPSASATENPIANFVAEGYVAAEADGFWVVVQATEAE